MHVHACVLHSQAKPGGAGLPCQHSFLWAFFPVGLLMSRSLHCALCEMAAAKHGRISLWSRTCPCRLWLYSQAPAGDAEPLDVSGGPPPPPPALAGLLVRPQELPPSPTLCVPVFGGTGGLPCCCACWPLCCIPEAEPWPLSPPCLAELAAAVRGARWDRTALQEVTVAKQPPPERSLFPGQGWKEAAEQHQALLHRPYGLSVWQHEHRES